MKLKKEYFILMILIVLLSVYLAVRGRDRTHYRLPPLARISNDKIVRIDIKGPEGHTLLKKDGSRWRLMPWAYPTDGDAVRKILQDIGGLKLTALVGESKNYQRYDLGEKQKIVVQAWSSDDKLLREFEVGKVAPSFGHTFVKVSGDGRVFHALGNLRDQLGKTPEDLRDKRVFSFDRRKILEIQITDRKETLVFKRGQTIGQEMSEKTEPKNQKTADDQQPPVWKVDKGGQVDAARIQKFLDNLDSLDCDGYLEGRKTSDFSEPVFEVRLKGDKEVYRLALFAPPDKKKETYPGISSQNEYVFFLEKWQADRVMLSPKGLVEKPEAVEK